jgi:AraC-like DNA-binding protein
VSVRPAAHEQLEISLGERATFYVFAALGSIYCDEDLVLDVPSSHEAAIALTACGAPFDFRVEDEIRRGLKAVLARHDKRRVMYARGTQFMAFRVAPLHPHFNRLFNGDMVELDRAQFNDLDADFAEIMQGRMGHARARTVFEVVVERVAATLAEPMPLDPRILHVLDMLRHDPDCMLETLAAAIGVSPSRLSHLFTAQMCLSLRSYAAWRRISNAMWMLMNDASLSMTDIAHRVGFSDSSHFTRTFYQFTGHRPTQVRGRGGVNIITC